MSEENVEIVRGFYEQAARGDFSWIPADDDFVFVTSPEMPDAGTYRGAAAREWITAWVGSFADLTMETTEIIDAGGDVVVGILQRGRIRASEPPVEGRWWQVLTLRDGRVGVSRLFSNRGDALEAAGLEE